MRLRFDEVKATQAAAFFLARRGGRMHYLKLIKLLYLADREALLRWGTTITTDRHVSMDHGPIVSKIYSLITEDKPKPSWSEYISAPLGDYEVELRKPAVSDRLSGAEEKLMDEIHEKFGHQNRWAIVDYLHTLPEWKDPQGSSLPISIRDILKAGGEDEEEIRAVLKELHAIAAAEDSLARVYA